MSFVLCYFSGLLVGWAPFFCVHIVLPSLAPPLHRCLLIFLLWSQSSKDLYSKHRSGSLVWRARPSRKLRTPLATPMLLHIKMKRPGSEVHTSREGERERVRERERERERSSVSAFRIGPATEAYCALHWAMELHWLLSTSRATRGKPLAIWTVVFRWSLPRFWLHRAE